MSKLCCLLAIGIALFVIVLGNAIIVLTGSNCTITPEYSMLDVQ
jgi:hypothetical protein